MKIRSLLAPVGATPITQMSSFSRRLHVLSDRVFSTSQVYRYVVSAASFCVFCLLMLGRFYDATAKEEPGRSVHFSGKDPLGMLHIANAGSETPRWEKFGTAHGNVTVPPGKDLLLELGYPAALDDLKPGDLQGLWLFSYPGKGKYPWLGVSSEWLGRLQKFSSLRELRIRYVRIADGGVAELCKLKFLAELELGGTCSADADLLNLGNLTSLKSLSLGGWEGRYVTDSSLRGLRNLTGLKSLTLWHCAITGEGLSNIVGFKSLKELNLRETGMSDLGMQYVGGLTSLQILRLGFSQVSDAGLAHLQNLTQLRDLGLDTTRITDAGLEYLKTLTNLQTLDIRQTRVTEKGARSLQEALPHCTVVGPAISTQIQANDKEKALRNPAGKPLLEGLEASVSTSKPAFKLGEPIIIQYEMKNAGQQTRTVCFKKAEPLPDNLMPKPWHEPDAVRRIQQKLATGGVVWQFTITVDGKGSLAPMDGLMVTAHAEWPLAERKDFVVLSPGKSYRRAMNLLDYDFVGRFSTPGQYSVYVEYENPYSGEEFGLDVWHSHTEPGLRSNRVSFAIQ